MTWYVDKFTKAIGPDVQAAISFALIGGYRDAAEACQKHFPRFGWRKALGAQRWFFLQEALMRLADEYPNLQPTLLPNCVHSHYFGLARAGDVYFTIAKVSEPAAKPPSALFRQALQSPVQMSWLNEWLSLPPSGLCGLLIHGPDTSDPSKPAFVQIKFMDGNDNYLPEHIDLYREFIAKPITVERTEIERRPLVRPRQQTQQASG